MTPTPLKTVVTAGQATVGRRGVKVPVACEGGDAWNHCHGRITSKGGGRKIASAAYSLEADQAQNLAVPFSSGVHSPLARRRSMAAVVAVVATSGNGSSHKVSLKRATVAKQ